ncbi:MAG: autotransporter-associated beta strand repeat-containing protein [Ottowia sp.]|nr:autotransporter-associated beta strand repeat-containing protein [Ottowia sp.]
MTATGNITTTFGSVSSAGQLKAADISAVGGAVSSVENLEAASITANDDISSQGSLTATGNITTTAGSVSSAGNLEAASITASNGISSIGILKAGQVSGRDIAAAIASVGALDVAGGQVAVGTLDVVGGNTTLNLDGTTAAHARFNNVDLGGRTLTAHGTNGGEASIDTLTLTGAGRLSDSGGALKIGKLSINGGTLNDDNWNELYGRTYTDDNDNIHLDTGGLTIDLGSSQNLERKLTGTGALVKAGDGQLTLTQASDYSGGTQLKAGTLALTNASAAGTGEIAAGSGATLRLAAENGAFGNTLTATGGTLEVAKRGVSVLSISGFENLHFILPADTAAGDTVLDTGSAPVALGGVNISVGGDVPTLAPGEALTLISSVSGTPAASSGVPSGLVLDASSGALVLKAPQPGVRVISDTPTMSELGLLLSGIALAGVAVPALRRRERRGRKEREQD